jgi:hypothetical protein
MRYGGMAIKEFSFFIIKQKLIEKNMNYWHN